MKRLLISGLLSLLLLPQLGRATDATYVNNGTITFPPQIDATNVINFGTFNFGGNPTVEPFDTSNTRNFTNSGFMIGSVGFRFDNAPNTGSRILSANFHNRLPGSITADDGFGALVQLNGVPIETALLTPSYLWVAATNIINQGTLTAGGAGILRLAGTNVNLSRSGVQIQPIQARGSFQPVFTNYFTPDVAIYDYYWGQTNQTMDSSAIIQGGGAVVSSPWSAVQFAARFPFASVSGFAKLTLASPYGGSFYTNTLATTNISITNITGGVTITNVPLTNIVQAVFVGLPEADNVDWGVRFYPSSSFGNPFRTVAVKVAMFSTNVVSATPELTSLYLVDTLASETNRSFYTNFTSVYNLRPQNYLLERRAPLEYFAGSSGNADFAPDLLYKKDFASAVVTNDYGAYAAFVDNIASRPPNIPAGTVTNLPGRVEVFADTLDMTRTRFRADGLLNVNARHLILSTNPVVDCENLSYNIGSTNGNLTIQGLAEESVARFMGTNYVWSGLWTNQQNMLIENYAPDPDDTNSFIPSPITNVVEVRIYSMIMYAGDLLTQVPVVVNSLVTHSTNVVVNDKMTVVQSFLTDAQNFTINGGITFSNTFFTDTRGATVTISLDSWIGTNAPNLKFFTNNGTLKIPNEAHFGDDRPLPYTAFVDHGTITAYGQTINSDYCELGGNNTTVANYTVIARSGKVEGATLSSGGDLQFSANVLKFSQAAIQTDGRLYLSVTNSLFDSGGASGNTLACNDGFSLLVKPQTGDLLGTAVNTLAPTFAEVDHLWAGADRGPSKAGFLNNTALGTLTLTPGSYEAQFPPLFLFAGTGNSNGLYVDMLDLSQLLDYQSELAIQPNLVIYYAAAKLSFTPSGGQSARSVS
ncbi:MAG: hypothetical protein V9H26_09940 [Verrucomicrobiota bacterium]